MLMTSRPSQTLNAQRTTLSSYLETRRSAILDRVRLQIELESRSDLMIELLLEEFCDEVFESISNGSWTETRTWFNARFTDADPLDLGTRAMAATLREMEAETERFLPRFAPGLGEVRIQFRHLEGVLQDELSDADDKEHDPIDVAVDDIVHTIDNKDFATGEHSRAVSAWSTRIARRLGLSEGMVVKVTRGGLIHDIGKTTTPLHILTAARKLSDEEWAVMANHVVAGWEMLQAMPVLTDFTSIVRHHHERYEGGGYPDNLDRDDIPLSTRIVTIADCFNAMIGRRPYRTPLSPLGAVDELLRCRGTQFDPDVTDAMAELVYEMIEQGGLSDDDANLRVNSSGLIEDADVIAANKAAAQLVSSEH